MQPNRPAYTLKFYDSSDELEGVITSNSGFSPLLNVEFDVTKKGSGKCQFDLAYRPGFEIYHSQRMKVFLWNQDEPYWSGYVTLVPGEFQSDNTWRYRALGWPTLLGEQVYTGLHDSSVLDTIVRFILIEWANFAPILRYDAGKVGGNASPVVYLEFASTQSDQVIRTLERLSNGWTIGVDHDRYFTFQHFNDTTIDADHVLIVGKEIQEWKPETDSSELWNSAVVKMGGVNNDSQSEFYKTNLTGQVEGDSASINAHGLRVRVVDAPNALHKNDAQKYAQAELAEAKDPKPNNPAQRVLFDGRRWTPGRFLRVLLPDGSQDEHQLVRNRYQLQGGAIWCTLYLGSDDQTLARLQAQLTANQANAEFARQASQRFFQLS